MCLIVLGSIINLFSYDGNELKYRRLMGTLAVWLCLCQPWAAVLCPLLPLCSQARRSTRFPDTDTGPSQRQAHPAHGHQWSVHIRRSHSEHHHEECIIRSTHCHGNTNLYWIKYFKQTTITIVLSCIQHYLRFSDSLSASTLCVWP